MKYFITILFFLNSLNLQAQKTNWKVDISIQNMEFSTFLTQNNKGDQILFTSPKNADKRLFGGFKSIAGRATGKLPKKGILVNIKSEKTKDIIEGDIDIFGIDNKLRLEAKIDGDSISGKIYDPAKNELGTLSGVKSVEAKIDFSNLYEKIIQTTENNLYSTEPLKSKEWKKFKKEMKDLTSKAVDDIELYFGFQMLSQELPFSHYYLVFMNDLKENEDPDEKTVFFEEKNSNTAYLKIKDFESSKEELSEILPGMISNENYKNLIIDLRDNRGGGIEAAYEFGKYFISGNTLIGYFPTQRLSYVQFDENVFETLPISKAKTTEEFIDELKKGKGEKMVFENDGNPIYKGKIYVLTNANTASTCEPIIYTLKNKALATIVGENTAGQMLSAAEFKIKDKYKLILPIADFFTYDGVRLDAVGVKPDIEVKSEDALNEVLINLKP